MIQLTLYNTGSDNSMALIRWQVIIWTNDGLVYCRLFGPLPKYAKLWVAPTWECRERFPHHRQRKPLVSDPGMLHGTCVMQIRWCIPGSLTRGGWEDVPGILGASQPAILRIWQEAHAALSLEDSTHNVDIIVIFLDEWGFFLPHTCPWVSGS